LTKQKRQKQKDNKKQQNFLKRSQKKVGKELRQKVKKNIKGAPKEAGPPFFPSFILSALGS
jgi:hypothetical protein